MQQINKMAVKYIQTSIAHLEDTCPRGECRICLEVMQEATFCGCRGYHKTIHPRCLLEWIKRKATPQDIARKASQCEICRHEIALDIDTRYSCHTCEDICHQNLSKDHCDIDTKFVLLLSMFIVSAMLVGVLAWNYNSNEVKTKQLVYGLVSMSLIASLSLLLIIGCYFVKKDHLIRGISEKRELWLGRRRGRVAPIAGESD